MAQVGRQILTRVSPTNSQQHQPLLSPCRCAVYLGDTGAEEKPLWPRGKPWIQAGMQSSVDVRTPGCHQERPNEDAKLKTKFCFRVSELSIGQCTLSH